MLRGLFVPLRANKIFNVKKNETYTVNFDIKSSIVNKFVYVKISTGETLAYSFWVSIPAGKTVKVSKTFKAKANAKTVYFGMGGDVGNRTEEDDDGDASVRYKVFGPDYATQLANDANGDINSIESAEKCMELSNADGVAIGRAAVGDPSLIYRIEHFFKTGERLAPPNLDEKIIDLKTHLDEEIALRGEKVGIKFVRKFYPFYINGVRNAAKYRSHLVLIEDYQEIINALDYIYKENSEKIQISV